MVDGCWCMSILAIAILFVCLSIQSDTTEK